MSDHRLNRYKTGLSVNSKYEQCSECQSWIIKKELYDCRACYPTISKYCQNCYQVTCQESFIGCNHVFVCRKHYNFDLCQDCMKPKCSK